MVTELTYDLSTIRDLLGASSAFRAWVSEATAALAKEHVKYFRGDLTDFPVAVVYHDGAWKRDCVALDGTFYTEPHVVIEFIDDCSKSDSDETVFGTLGASVSEIMADLEAQTTWRVLAWYPGGEDAFSRAQHSAATDIVGFRVTIDGDVR